MLGRAFKELVPGNTKTGIRMVTWQNPTMAKLVKWGKEQDSSSMCGAPTETAAHVMLRCPSLSNAITAAHDTVLEGIRHVLRSACPEFTQHWCARAGDLFPSLTNTYPPLRPLFVGAAVSRLERLTPDAIFVHDDGKLIFLLELACTGDIDDDYWRKRQAAKEEKHRPLRAAIAAATGAEGRQATLVIGIRGSLYKPE